MTRPHHPPRDIGDNEGAHPRPCHDEQGAVAIVVALLLIVLLAISAFAVDVGLAYTERQQLQVAADAGVLAAAASYAEFAGTCGLLASSATDAATEAAHAVALGNLADEGDLDGLTDIEGVAGVEVVSEIEALCTSDGAARISVSWGLSQSVPTSFAAVSGVDEITTEATATAELSVVDAVELVRPYLLCSKDVPAVIPSSVTTITYDGDVDPDCLGSSANDAWWVATCPAPDGGIASATANGCTSPVSSVRGQSAAMNRGAHLLDACAAAPPEDCLDAEDEVVADTVGWTGLLGQEVVLPVFCGGAGPPVGQPACAMPAVVAPGLPDTRYPVQGLASVVVCGFNWGSDPGDGGNVGNTFGPPCENVEAQAAVAPENSLLLAFTRTLAPGTLSPLDCQLGDSTCDRGLRMVRLVE